MLKHFLFALVVGVACGFASVILCILVGWAYDCFNSFTWLVWLLPAVGILELALYKALRLPLDMTTGTLIGDMAENKRISYALAPGILAATCMSVFCGASVGKEAGALQIGASLGSLISRPFNIRSIYKTEKNDEMNNYAAGCGMAACFSALFFAPLGSCMLVLELVRFRRPLARHFISMVFACSVAYVIASLIGIGDIIPEVALPAFSWQIAVQCVIVGVAAAIFGTVLGWGIGFAQAVTKGISNNIAKRIAGRFDKRMDRRSTSRKNAQSVKCYAIWVCAGGIIFATLVTAFGWGAFTGTGGDTLTQALQGHFTETGFLVKMLLTFVCLGFWLKGGEIMPSFCIGGLMGAACSSLAGYDPLFGAAIGVLAFFAAFSRCPLGAFLMGCEIFGWAATPFLAISVAVAFALGKLFLHLLRKVMHSLPKFH